MKPRHIVGLISLQVLGTTALIAQSAPTIDPVPLKNWAAPLYWQPNQLEKEAASKSGAQIQFSSTAASNTALVFVAVSPCRLVDTRGSSSGFIGSTPFNGPFIPAGGTAAFPVQSTTEQQTTAPSPCGVIPSIAQAYSLNLTVVPHPFSTPVNYVTMWPTGTTLPAVSTLNDQQGMVVANAAIVPAGSPSGGISVYAYGATDVIIDMNGFYAAPTDLSGNTAVGGGALLTNTAGIQNTATGNDALQANTTGNDNTATGANAMQYNTTGGINTANGFSALRNNTTGTGNTASGASALINNTTGNNNTAGGFSALYANTTGTGNTASGFQSLMNNETGSGNIAIGNAAGSNFVGGSNNIHIGNVGTSSDNNVIKIGTQGTQTATSIAGVYGGSPNISTLQLVCVDANGILGNLGCGSTPSSRRFKEQIADMGDSSNKLLQLRPVTFLYKPEYNDGSHALQYGLIAEEVAKLYPDMVGYDKDGQPNSVKYQSLTPMLLNEVQKQNARLQNEVRIREAENRKLEDRVAALEALLSSLATPAVRPAGSQ